MSYNDYKKQAIKDLSDYNYLKSSLLTLSKRIQLLQNNFSQGAYNSQTKVMVSISTDEKVIAHISQIEQLEHTLKCNTLKVQSIENALSALPEKDRNLMMSFYVNRQRNSVATLARNSYTDRSCIYRRAQKSLEKYIFAFFGIEK